MGLQSQLGLPGVPAVRSALPKGNREMGFLPAETPEREREGMKESERDIKTGRVRPLYLC